MGARRWIALAVVAGAGLLVAGRAIATVYVDYGWYDAVGAIEVWRAQIVTALWLRMASGVAAALFVFANLYAVRHSVVSLVLPRRLANLEIGEEVPGRHLMIAAAALSTLAGAALALPYETWTAFILARHGEPFGEGDPYFQHDLGFFVYWLPFERALYVWTLIVSAVVVVIVVGLYAMTPSLRITRGRLYVSTYVRRHLTVLCGALLLVVAWSFRLDMYHLLSDGSGPDAGFTFVDHRVAIPGDLVLAIVAFGAALVVVWAGWTGQIRLAFFALSAVLLLSLVVKQVAPVIANRIGPVTDPIVRDRPYAATRALYGRRAFGIDAVALDTTVGYGSIAELAQAVTVWDGPAIRRVFERSRPGHELAGSIGWVADETQVTALVAERPATGAANWPVPWTVSRIVATAADDEGGLIRVNARDPVATLAVVHDTTAPPVVVSDVDGRIAGTSLGSRFARIAHAWGLQDSRLLTEDVPTEPELVLHRGVRERVRALAPFFSQGTVVSPLMLGDSLYWSLHLYSTSRYYPLSNPVTHARESVTYLRHAAIAVIEAASGRVVIVGSSAPDPVAASWMRRFPALFLDPERLPLDLRRQLQPASDVLEAQSIAVARYGGSLRGMRSLRRPTTMGSDTVLQSDRPMFAVGRPRTVATGVPMLDQADHPVGLLVRTGGERARTVWVPAGLNGPPWTAMLAQLRTGDGRFPAGAMIARGMVRAVPAQGSLAFVQPAYAWHLDGGPQLVQTSLVLADSLAAGPTLQALAEGRTGLMAPRPAADLRGAIGRLYDVMRRATRDGDWQTFGRAFDSIGVLLGRRRP